MVDSVLTFARGPTFPETRIFGSSPARSPLPPECHGMACKGLPWQLMLDVALCAPVIAPSFATLAHRCGGAETAVATGQTLRVWCPVRRWELGLGDTEKYSLSHREREVVSCPYRSCK
jgi:hypothetical protein